MIIIFFLCCLFLSTLSPFHCDDFYSPLKTSPSFTVYWLSECGCTGVEKESVAITSELYKYFIDEEDSLSQFPLWSPSLPSDRLRLRVNPCDFSSSSPSVSPSPIEFSAVPNDRHNDLRCPGYRPEVKRILYEMTKIYGVVPSPPSSPTPFAPLLFPHRLPLSVIIIHVTHEGLCGIPSDLISPLLSYNSLPSSSSPPPYLIGRIFGESNGLDDIALLRCLQNFNEWWVPTKFYKNVLFNRVNQYNQLYNTSYSMRTVHVIPKTVDMKVFHKGNPNIRQMELFNNPPDPSKKSFIFLSVFKWEPRKDWTSLLVAFLSAFPSATHPNVKLYIHTIPFAKSNPIVEVTQFLSSPPLSLPMEVIEDILRERIKISVQTSPLPESSLPSLYASSHVFTLCSHGEGWNLPLLEGMSMGLPTITLNFSGPTEFTRDDLVYYVKYSLVNVTAEGEEGSGNLYGLHGHSGEWAQVDREDYARILRYVYDNYEGEVKERSIKMEDWVRKQFNMKRVGRIFAKRIQQIEGEIKGKIKEKTHDEL